MIPLRWDEKPEGLRNPVLVCAFKGWSDAGEAASSSIGVLRRRLGAVKCATVDPELIYASQTYRPMISIEDGISKGLRWPTVELWAAKVEHAKRDIILVTGQEPSMRWQSLTDSILDAATSMGCNLVISLGALLSDVPHTRPVPLTGVTSDLDLLAEIDPMLPNYEGPSGMTGILHVMAAERGINSVSVLAHVPHYVGAIPSPKGALALVNAVETLTGIDVPTDRLQRAADRYESQVTKVIENDPERAEMVHRLEQLSDIANARDEDGDELDDEELIGDLLEQIELNDGDIPSADSLAKDFQDFLSQQDGSNEDAHDDDDDQKAEDNEN